MIQLVETLLSTVSQPVPLVVHLAVLNICTGDALAVHLALLDVEHVCATCLNLSLIVLFALVQVVLAEYGLGAIALYYLAPLLLGGVFGSLRGYAGEISAAQALDLVANDGSAVIIDIRTEVRALVEVTLSPCHDVSAVCLTETLVVVAGDLVSSVWHRWAALSVL